MTDVCNVFKEHLAVTGRQDVTIEDAFRALAEYSGIHLFNFDDELADDFDSLSASIWDTANATGTWGVASDMLQGDGPGSSDWGFLLSVEDVPQSFVAKVTKHDDVGGLAFLAEDEDNLYFAWWNATAVGIALVDDGDVSILCSVPKDTFDGESELCLSVQRDEEGYFVSLWFDEQFGVNAYIALLPSHYRFGFATYDTDTDTEYSDLRIAELTEVLAIVTMDVGENPAGALSRAIGRRHINHFVRFNGELRAWRPKAADSVLTLGIGDVYQHDEKIDRKGLVSHWRQIGAWHVADAHDTDLLAQLGHKFHKDDNPDLMTEQECEDEAERSIVRCKEYSHVVSADYPLYMFQEPEDRITIRGEDWVLTTYGFRLRAGAIDCRADLREYVYA